MTTVTLTVSNDPPIEQTTDFLLTVSNDPPIEQTTDFLLIMSNQMKTMRLTPGMTVELTIGQAAIVVIRHEQPMDPLNQTPEEKSITADGV